MNRDDIIEIYGKYSAIYDAIFSRFFSPRIRMGLSKSNIKQGDRVIEVGVGTGLSLALYPDDCTVVGIDLTRKMLNKAHEKKKELNLRHVELMEMDAENIAFADDSFDHAVAGFVVSVVPNPEKMVSELKRVTKKDGTILILNHFCSNNALVSKVEKLFSPLCERWGWRSDITLDLLSNHCNLHIKQIFKKNRFDPWSIIIASNNK